MVSPKTGFVSYGRYTKAIEACYVVIGLFQGVQFGNALSSSVLLGHLNAPRE